MHLVTGGAGFSGSNILRHLEALSGGHRAGAETLRVMRLGLGLRKA